MALGRLMTVEIQGVDLILSQALKMNMHGVSSYYNWNYEVDQYSLESVKHTSPQ